MRRIFSLGMTFLTLLALTISCVSQPSAQTQSVSTSENTSTPQTASSSTVAPITTSISTPTKPTEQVSGIISTDTIWISDNIYHATNNVEIPSGVTLTIAPGTTIDFDPGSELEVSGTLIAKGTPDDNILFTCSDPHSSVYWEGILFLNDSSPTSELTYCIIERAMRDIHVQSVSLLIQHDVIRLAYNCGILLEGETQSQVGISQNLISDCFYYGIAIDTTSYVTVTVSENTITNNLRGVFLSMMSTNVSISSNNLYSNSEYNLRAEGTGRSTNVKSIDATNNWWGTADKTSIEQSINDHNEDLTAPTVIFIPFASALIPGDPSF